jgi:FAD/FMN-containing dehydrogenase
MHMVNSELLSRLSSLLGPKGLTTDPGDIAPWLSDWRGLYHGQSAAMLSPATTAEVAAVVRLAAEFGVALVPQGGNTSMVGGATPPDDGSAMILSLRRMNRMRSTDAESRQLIAEAGVILEHVHDEAGKHALRFPLSLGAKGSATIGGLTSTNAGGTQVLRHGTMRKLVLGVEAVLPDGTVHHGLAPLKKDTRGYDLNQLLIGAEGTLGVITAVMLQLVPALADQATAWFAIESPQSALTLLRFLEREAPGAVESFELIPDDSLKLVLDHLPTARAPLSGAHRWHALVEFGTGDTERRAVEQLTALAERAFAKGLAQDGVIASSIAQSQAFWLIRESISAAERAAGPAMQHDISVPVEMMPRFMVEAAAEIEATFPGVTASAFGHLGDGNVHFHVRAPHGADASAWRAGQGKAASDRVYDLVMQAHGSISAEHGIGQMKRQTLARVGPLSQIKALRAIKLALDPGNLMNPGKLVPLATDDCAA